MVPLSKEPKPIMWWTCDELAMNLRPIQGWTLPHPIQWFLQQTSLSINCQLFCASCPLLHQHKSAEACGYTSRAVKSLYLPSKQLWQFNWGIFNSSTRNHDEWRTWRTWTLLCTFTQMWICKKLIITITVQDVLAWFRSERRSKSGEFQAFKYTVAPWPDHGCVLLYWWRFDVSWTEHWVPGNHQSDFNCLYRINQF